MWQTQSVRPVGVTNTSPHHNLSSSVKIYPRHWDEIWQCQPKKLPTWCYISYHHNVQYLVDIHQLLLIVNSEIIQKYSVTNPHKKWGVKPTFDSRIPTVHMTILQASKMLSSDDQNSQTKTLNLSNFGIQCSTPRTTETTRLVRHLGKYLSSSRQT